MFAFVIGLLTTACLANASPAVRMHDSIRGLNDEARWGRTDLAMERVSPAYQEKFIKARRAWGKDIQIADSEVISIKTKPENTAISEVVIQWYSYENMTLRQSTLRQVWKSSNDHYYLRSERVIEGDKSIL